MVMNSNNNLFSQMRGKLMTLFITCTLYLAILLLHPSEYNHIHLQFWTELDFVITPWHLSCSLVSVVQFGADKWLARRPNAKTRIPELSMLLVEDCHLHQEHQILELYSFSDDSIRSTLWPVRPVCVALHQL